MKAITEAEKKEFMSKREQSLKKALIALLKDDGKGHKHAKYAERLLDFDIKIVPLGQQPETAAISFDEGIIYINEGFLTDPSTFYQLNVLMRHELAHNLMMHQIRMAHKIESKYGKEGETRISLSRSIRGLLNIIEDFEISNKRYTEEDKRIVRNMYLNGRLIQGLVTEDHRSDWENLSVTDMYDKLSDEIEKIQKEILLTWDNDKDNTPDTVTSDYITSEIDNTYYYVGTPILAEFSGTAEDFINNKGAYHFFPYDEFVGGVILPCWVKLSNLPTEWQTLLKTVFEAFSDVKLYELKILDRQSIEIAKSSPTEAVDIIDPTNGAVIAKVYTPEEKTLVRSLLQKIKDPNSSGPKPPLPPEESGDPLPPEESGDPLPPGRKPPLPPLPPLPPGRKPPEESGDPEESGEESGDPLPPGRKNPEKSGDESSQEKESKSAYDSWHDRLNDILDNPKYSDQDLAKILDAIK